MLSCAPPNWVYDFVDHYRLNKDIIQGYLQEKWGEYDFRVTVNLAPSHAV